MKEYVTKAPSGEFIRVATTMLLKVNFLGEVGGFSAEEKCVKGSKKRCMRLPAQVPQINAVLLGATHKFCFGTNFEENKLF